MTATGLDVVETLHTVRPDSRVVVLTGFGNIATAVAAVKYGAIDYLPKPADADDILAALMAPPGSKPKPPENPMSADRVRWEHIQRVYELVRPQRVGDGAPAEHASPHAAADSGEEKPAVDSPAPLEGAWDLENGKDARARFAGKGVYPVDMRTGSSIRCAVSSFLPAGWCAASTLRPTDRVLEVGPGPAISVRRSRGVCAKASLCSSMSSRACSISRGHAY